MRERFEQVRDYHGIYTSYTTDGKDEREITFHYYFKKPKLIRMEVIEGKQPGSILIYNPSKKSNKVHIKTSNFFYNILLKFKGYYLDSDDKRVCDLRGYGVHQSDWGWYIDEHLRIAEMLENNYEVSVLHEERINRYEVVLVEFISGIPDSTNSVETEKIWIDKLTFFPIKVEQYDSGGRLVFATSFSDIIFNSGIDEKIFIEFNPE
jgi:outer membrane lipoprotein-sorting protein